MRNLRLVCHPGDDVAFESTVQALFARIAKGADTDDDLAAAIVEKLRVDYPSVRIRSRDPIAEYSVEQATWYVYRDGRATGSERTDGDP
jgi:hypothetical protein